MSKTNFIWAQSHDANVREPIKELSEKGWQHRDIPKASNMNWIFKQISEDLATLRKETEQYTAEIRNKLDEQESKLKKQAEALDGLKTELGSLYENHDNLRTCTKHGLEKAFRANDFNIGITKNICTQLRALELSIRHYHSNFPEFHWPLEDHFLLKNNDEDKS